MDYLEIYYTILIYVNFILRTLLISYSLYWFARPFMKNKNGALFAGMAYFAVMFLLYLQPLVIDNFTAYGIGVLSAFAVMCRADCRNYCQKIFITSTFFSLRWISGYMSGIILKIIYEPAVNTEYMAKHLLLQFILSAGINVFIIIINFAVIMTGIRYIVKAYIYKSENMSIKELAILVLPSVTGMAGYGIMQCYQTYFNKAAIEAVTGIYNSLAILYCSISIVTIVVMIVLFQNIKAGQEEKLQNELLAAQVSNIKRHIGQVESFYQNIYSIKHDMARHIATLEKLCLGNKTEEARAYSSDLKAAFTGTAADIKSGNPVTDVILQEFKNETEKKNISFCSDFYYPVNSNANAFDISVILNNALQNAVENAEKSESPHIHIASYRRDNVFMIEVSNSFTGDLLWCTESGLPVTLKEKGNGHGYGLSNIRKIAQKYSGDIAIDLKKQKFYLSIMLIIE